MSSLVVGGVTIPVAVSSPSFSRLDAVDRGRMFDNTYYASLTGGGAREWDFSTPPVSTTDAATYSAVIGRVAAQLCSGDILELPTMCCAEYTGGTPVRTAVGHRVVLNFRLHEVQPERVLLRYTPGDTIEGETFTRSTIGYYLNGGSSTPLSWAAINVKRDTHNVGGIRSLLLEGASTNLILRGNDFGHAAWARTNITVGTGIADPAGGTDACTLTASAANGNVYQNGGNGASIVRSASLWIKRRTGTGSVFIIAADGANSSALAVTTVWTRFAPPSAAAVGRYCGIQLATSGDAIDVWCPQVDDYPFPTSEIPTVASSVTRGADSYSIPFTTPPQEMTVYTKFLEGGSKSTGAAFLFAICNAAGAVPRFVCTPNTGFYSTQHYDDATAVTSTPAVAPALGNVTEKLSRFFGDGSVDDTQTINAGAAVVSAQSSALALEAAWSGPLCWLNSGGSGSVGFTAIQQFKIVAASRSLVEMRTL